MFSTLNIFFFYSALIISIQPLKKVYPPYKASDMICLKYDSQQYTFF